jgi:cysteine-rich repeat protein
MRAPRALLTLLTISACNGSNDGDSVSVAGQTSEGATTEATGTGLATTPTTTVEPGTTTDVSDGTSGATPTSTTGEASTGAAETGATSSGATTVGETTGSETTGSGTGTSTGDASTGAVSDTGGSSTGPGCPEGQEGCPCGNGCDVGLACELGVCVPMPPPKCGDGKIDAGEACDDGANNGDSKACTSKCTKQACGDGFLGANEQCDDGNLVDGDGCEKTCVKTPMQAKDACGFDSDGVWFQIDYSNAFTVSNPTYTYSPTPGWGEAQWAPAGKNWPYAVDLFNNAAVVNDQIGKVALLDGTNKAVRVYFGLVGLSYTYATVCVEGRSYSVGSSVQFFVEEAKNKCGDYGSMANDWSVHATGVDMQDCFLPNDSFQAVQVQPSGGSGSLSLKRLRVTLHGASY